MLRFLIILTLTVYVLTKIGSFFFRAGVFSQRQQPKPNYTKRAPDAAQPGDARKKGAIKGGEYVDYEEVK